MQVHQMNTVDNIIELFGKKGNSAYFGERVSQTEHALQTAYLATQDQAAPFLIVAALLHDIGHLVYEIREDIADNGIDGRHETVGGAWLSRYFGPEVTEPITLHVLAKRYLCSVDQNYLAGLSPSSVQSLSLQGGLLLPSEVCAFEMNAYFREAVALRHWDDGAKIVGIEVPEFEDYRALIEGCCL